MINEQDDHYNEVAKYFGTEILNEVIFMVNEVGEPDSVYTVYEDMEMWDHAMALEAYYFEK